MELREAVEAWEFWMERYFAHAVHAETIRHDPSARALQLGLAAKALRIAERIARGGTGPLNVSR